MSRELAESFDYVIAGGGTAGCVLASRLSANPDVRVLLLEAGPDFPPDSVPDSIATGAFRAHHDPRFWGPVMPVELSGARTAAEAGRVGAFRVPRVIGGGSSVNGMHAQRGLPDDYDSWKELGVRGWSWADLMPYFVKLETDVDYDGPGHGRNGPIEIRRISESEWSALSRSMAEALCDRGIPRTRDLSTATGDGVGPVPLNLRGPLRASVPSAYLDATARSRPNLTILGRARVKRVLINAQRAVGVEAEVHGASRIIQARQTIISAGALGSPLLLLRSGIGPARHLRDCSLPVHADRPGIGRALRNHVHLSLGVHLNAAGRQAASAIAPCTMVARYSSRVVGTPETDMMLNVWERTPGALDWDPLSRQFAVVMVLLNAPLSSGDIQLDPTDPIGREKVRFNLFDDRRDLERVILGVQLAGEVLAAPQVAPLVNAAFFPTPNRFSAVLNRYDWPATALSVAGSLALRGPHWLKRRVLHTQGVSLESVLSDSARLREQVIRDARPASHATSTCRMGDVKDPYAVTDSRCKVIGVEGLRVVDCSIFPTTVRAGTHIPAIMAAEKAADMIHEDDRLQRPKVATW